MDPIGPSLRCCRRSSGLPSACGKPCYTFNRCLQPINIVVADMRQTRPAGKVRPASDGASEPVADIFGGLCRSIEQCSRADAIYEEQFKYAVAGGFGAWRIMPTYMADDGDGAFDQVLRLINISNPQTVIWDPQCADPCGGDANKCIVAERIAEEVYDQLYKDGDGQSFNVSRDSYGWFTDKEVRIAEYFERIPRAKRIAKMTDGTVQEYDADLRAQEAHFDANEITNETHGVTRIAKDKHGKPMIRPTVVWQVMWVKCDGSNVLEGPYYYDWKRIPVVRCPGRYVNIEGRRKFQSLIRHAKDAQRSYNSRASDMIERSALLPKAPYLVTETMIKGYEGEWNQANTQSRPYLPYNVDKNAPETMPHRMEPLDLPQGALALAQMSIQDIQATIGYFDPALGNAEDMNRVSGKALVQHTKRSDLGSYEFIGGFRLAMQLTWEMMVDMIPKVYDSERIERIIGHDGIEKMVTVNGQPAPGREDIVNDLSKGTYDVEVVIGPSFQSARQEALDTLIAFSEALPNTAPMIADLLAKNIDTPDAQEMARRLRIPLIQQGLVQPTEAEKAANPNISQPSPQQQMQQKMQQDNATLLAAKAQKMQADAAIAGSRAQSSPQEQEKLKLGNMKLASEIHDSALGHAGIPDQGAQAANALDLQHQQNLNQQELQQNAATHQQGLVHENQGHVAGVLKGRSEHESEEQRAHREHEAEERRAHEKHQREMAREAERHEQKKRHADELNTQKVAAAKAMAAAKPKKPKKAT
ncbi:MAG: portal protein [Steroidobacteraceae bacterium]